MVVEHLKCAIVLITLLTLTSCVTGNRGEGLTPSPAFPGVSTSIPENTTSQSGTLFVSPSLSIPDLSAKPTKPSYPEQDFASFRENEINPIETDVFWGKWRIDGIILPEWLDVPYNSDEPGFKPLECVGFELEYGDGIYRVNGMEFKDVKYTSYVFDHTVSGFGPFSPLANYTLNELGVSERYRIFWEKYRYEESVYLESAVFDLLEGEEKTYLTGISFTVLDEDHLLLRPAVHNLLAVRLKEK